jgi:DNA repair photolyase
MRQPRHQLMTCRLALNRVKGMPFKWSLNPYRGCQHGCHYCYARASHRYLNLDAGEDFSTQLFVKTNVADVLRAELARPSWRRESVAVGTATDPYQPLEGTHRLTRACVAALADGRTPGSVTTKGTLVLRDLDVLQAWHASAGCAVNVSLITLDEAVWRTLEPGTPPPRQRLRALQKLANANVPAGLALAPVLPGLTDAPTQLKSVVRAAADHGAEWVWCSTPHLEPAVRDWFLGVLAHEFPRVAPAYARVYGAPGTPGGARYAPSAYTDRIERWVAELRQSYGLSGSSIPRQRQEPERPRQLALAL